MAEEKEVTALEVLEEAIKEPTLDWYLDQNPRKHTPQDRENLILALRKERAMFIQSKQEKKDKKSNE
jgi:hypothetical protein